MLGVIEACVDESLMSRTLTSHDFLYFTYISCTSGLDMSKPLLSNYLEKRFYTYHSLPILERANMECSGLAKPAATSRNYVTQRIESKEMRSKHSSGDQTNRPDKSPCISFPDPSTIFSKYEFDFANRP